jgi:hypothetical protein
MVENLLHANIVLSSEQYQILLTLGSVYRVPKEIGTITYLGVDSVDRDTVHLLIRFEKFAYVTPMVSTIIELMFGKKYEMAFGNDIGMFGSYLARILITTKLKDPLRNPQRFIQGRAERLAAEIVNWRREEAREHREEADEDWHSYLKHELPEIP